MGGGDVNGMLAEGCLSGSLAGWVGEPLKAPVPLIVAVAKLARSKTIEYLLVLFVRYFPHRKSLSFFAFCLVVICMIRCGT